ncbi:MAG: DRTGG domain-containing protein [Clostridia bacterium]|nr:DRTGG domain-containing protein [Clostridia bacterium]
MTLNDIKEKLSLEVIAGEDGLSNEVSGCYIGDLLSWVLGKANSGDVLVSVMGNSNAVAVCSMIDLAGLILTENSPLDEDARKKADAFSIPVLTTPLNHYQFANAFSKIFNQ